LPAVNTVAAYAGALPSPGVLIEADCRPSQVRGGGLRRYSPCVL
jgi:hypothetical protein